MAPYASFWSLGGLLLPGGPVLCLVASHSTPVLTACGTCAPEGIAQGEEKPQLRPALALNLRTARGQHEIQTMVYFCRVTVMLVPTAW